MVDSTCYVSLCPRIHRSSFVFYLFFIYNFQHFPLVLQIHFDAFLIFFWVVFLDKGYKHSARLLDEPWQCFVVSLGCWWRWTVGMYGMLLTWTLCAVGMSYPWEGLQLHGLPCKEHKQFSMSDKSSCKFSFRTIQGLPIHARKKEVWINLEWKIKTPKIFSKNKS